MTTSEKPAEKPAEKLQETMNHTSDGAEDKAQPAAAKAVEPEPPLTLDQRVQQRVNLIDALLREKELLMHKFVEKKVPRPYYVRWKSEANESYALLVNLKHRRVRQKAG